MSRASCLASILLLTACTAPEGKAGPGEADAPYRIGPDGAAGLTEAAPFTVPAMERAFEGLEVVSLPDPDLPAFEARIPATGAPLYVVTPDWSRGYTGAVSTSAADVAGPGGIRAGRSRLSDVAEELKAACAPPEEAGEIVLVCESDRFRLEFTGETGNPLLARQTYLPPLP
ncbi:hypothetical protein K1X12_16370 [Hyphomonas sp. WL0036]|uniref:hypothetical protein n=1 Tax=Hyphomonas sediminis TaxID=2866160 RepID=UPI001C808651|nr:hypothetical protein [Hyphomonas sediminis]MBY9068478.1 hypothetical protein [Hyphomonas sediminis]